MSLSTGSSGSKFQDFEFNVCCLSPFCNLFNGRSNIIFEKKLAALLANLRRNPFDKDEIILLINGEIHLTVFHFTFAKNTLHRYLFRIS
jgi:hypothetical protein